jgi:hypothetical protein
MYDSSDRVRIMGGPRVNSLQEPAAVTVCQTEVLRAKRTSYAECGWISQAGISEVRAPRSCSANGYLDALRDVTTAPRSVFRYGWGKLVALAATA